MLAVLKSPPTPGNYTIRWKTITEDGINPPGDELATLDSTIPESST